MISFTVLYFHLGVCKANCHFGNCGNPQRDNLSSKKKKKKKLFHFEDALQNCIHCASIISMLDLLPLQRIKSLYSCQCYKLLLDLNQMCSLWWVPSQPASVKHHCEHLWDSSKGRSLKMYLKLPNFVNLQAKPGQTRTQLTNPTLY